MNRKEIGDLGESIAVDHLKKNGYKIIKRNFRCSLGEIDIIASKRGEISFVEVRSKKGGMYGDPLESITLRKQRQITKVAKIYLSRLGKYPVCHFSVIGIVFDGNNKPSITFIPYAFDEC